MSALFIALSVALAVVGSARAETHTVRFQNNCGYGTPLLLQGGEIISHGEDYTKNGPFWSAIAYLQTGNCGFNGDRCSLMEMSLAGTMSSVDISLIPPLAFSDPVSFEFYGVCEGIGRTCSNAQCEMAFRVPDDNFVQQQCTKENANLLITFCPGGSASSSSSSAHVTSASSTTSSSSQAAPSTSTTPTSTKAAITSTSLSASSSSPISTSSAPATLPSSLVNRKSCQKGASGQKRRAHRRSDAHRRLAMHQL